METFGTLANGTGRIEGRTLRGKEDDYTWLSRVIDYEPHGLKYEVSGTIFRTRTLT
jgi:hypothetical protein